MLIDTQTYGTATFFGVRSFGQFGVAKALDVCYHENIYCKISLKAIVPIWEETIKGTLAYKRVFRTAVRTNVKGYVKGRGICL